MPTVTQLADRVSHVTGLDTTGTDRDKILSYLNQAYAYATLEAQANASSFTKTLTANEGDYSIGTAPLDVSDMLEIRSLWIEGDSGPRVLRQISEAEILRLRQGASSAGTPLFYATRGARELLLYPAPSSDMTLNGSYLASPPELVEAAPGAGQESTPTAIPSPFHYSVISDKAISLAFEYDNRLEEAATFDAKWAVAMERLLSWVSRFGGTNLSSVAEVGYDGPRDLDV